MLYGINPLQASIWKWCYLSFYMTCAWEQTMKTSASLYNTLGSFSSRLAPFTVFAGFAESILFSSIQEKNFRIDANFRTHVTPLMLCPAR